MQYNILRVNPKTTQHLTINEEGSQLLSNTKYSLTLSETLNTLSLSLKKEREGGRKEREGGREEKKKRRRERAGGREKEKEKGKRGCWPVELPDFT